jgi:ABC-type transport system involved in cytochrome c biogenesis permease subunit
MNMPSVLPYFWLYQSAFGLQVPAVALFLAYAFTSRRGFSAAATALLGASLLCHVLFVGASGWSAGRLPLASGFEALSAWGLALTALVVAVEWRYKMGLLGAFLAPLSAATLLMGFRFAHSDAVPIPGLGDAWLLAHVALVMLSYAPFTAAAGVAGAYLVQERQLKAKRLDPLFYELPSLQALEGLLAGLAGTGAAALGLGLLAGFQWRWNYDRSLGLGDPTVLYSVAMVWLYAVGLWLRARGPLRGRRFAWLCLAGFLLVFFGYYLVNLYFGGHGFLQAGGGR